MKFINKFYHSQLPAKSIQSEKPIDLTKHLPNEILYHIFSLNQEYDRLALVCKRWHLITIELLNLKPIIKLARDLNNFVPKVIKLTPELAFPLEDLSAKFQTIQIDIDKILILGESQACLFTFDQDYKEWSLCGLGDAIDGKDPLIYGAFAFNSLYLYDNKEKEVIKITFTSRTEFTTRYFKLNREIDDKFDYRLFEITPISPLVFILKAGPYIFKFCEDSGDDAFCNLEDFTSFFHHYSHAFDQMPLIDSKKNVIYAGGHLLVKYGQKIYQLDLKNLKEIQLKDKNWKKFKPRNGIIFS